LLPDNALKRAQIRFFVEYWASKISSQQFKLFGLDASGRQAIYDDLNASLARVSVCVEAQNSWCD
jgi:hypothetical protein